MPRKCSTICSASHGKNFLCHISCDSERHLTLAEISSEFWVIPIVWGHFCFLFIPYCNFIFYLSASIGPNKPTFLYCMVGLKATTKIRVHSPNIIKSWKTPNLKIVGRDRVSYYTVLNIVKRSRNSTSNNTRKRTTCVLHNTYFTIVSQKRNVSVSIWPKLQIKACL